MSRPRYTLRDARSAVERVRRLVGAPELTWTRTPDGRAECAEGALVLEAGNGSGCSWKILRLDRNGGYRELLRAGSARELCQMVDAFRAGYEYARAERRAQ